MSTLIPGTALTKTLEVNVRQLVGGYTDPTSVPEWAWISANATFSINQARIEKGDREMIISVDAEDLPDDLPASLTAIYRCAQQREADWILFHQN